MPRRPLLLLVLSIVSVAAGWGGAARADGCPASTCGTTSATVPGSRLLFLHENGQSGPLAGYDVVTGVERFQLPAGLSNAGQGERANHASKR